MLRLMQIGAVDVTPTGYGGHGIPSLHPFVAALHLPQERSSRGVRHRVAVAAVMHPFHDVVARSRRPRGYTSPNTTRSNS
jgi:hypothetical protein